VMAVRREIGWGRISSQMPWVSYQCEYRDLWL